MNALHDWFRKLVAWIDRHIPWAKAHPKAAAGLAILILAAIIISPIPPVP